MGRKYKTLTAALIHMADDEVIDLTTTRVSKKNEICTEPVPGGYGCLCERPMRGVLVTKKGDKPLCGIHLNSNERRGNTIRRV